jgi:hypothetical protein
VIYFIFFIFLIFFIFISRAKDDFKDSEAYKATNTMAMPGAPIIDYSNIQERLYLAMGMSPPDLFHNQLQEFVRQQVPPEQRDLPISLLESLECYQTYVANKEQQSSTSAEPASLSSTSTDMTTTTTTITTTTTTTSNKKGKKKANKSFLTNEEIELLANNPFDGIRSDDNEGMEKCIAKYSTLLDKLEAVALDDSIDEEDLDLQFASLEEQLLNYPRLLIDENNDLSWEMKQSPTFQTIRSLKNYIQKLYVDRNYHDPLPQSTSLIGDIKVGSSSSSSKARKKATPASISSRKMLDIINNNNNAKGSTAMKGIDVDGELDDFDNLNEEDDESISLMTASNIQEGMRVFTDMKDSIFVDDDMQSLLELLEDTEEEFIANQEIAKEHLLQLDYDEKKLSGGWLPNPQPRRVPKSRWFQTKDAEEGRYYSDSIISNVYWETPKWWLKDPRWKDYVGSDVYLNYHPLLMHARDQYFTDDDRLTQEALKKLKQILDRLPLQDHYRISQELDEFQGWKRYLEARLFNESVTFPVNESIPSYLRPDLERGVEYSDEIIEMKNKKVLKTKPISFEELAEGEEFGYNNETKPIYFVPTVMENYDWTPWTNITHQIESEKVSALAPVLRFINHMADLKSTKVKYIMIITRYYSLSSVCLIVSIRMIILSLIIKVQANIF